MKKTEVKIVEPIEVVNLSKAGIKGYNEMNGRVYSTNGIAATVRANSGGHNELKVLVLSGGGGRFELSEQQTAAGPCAGGWFG